MQIRIGEALVRKGLISAEQLDSALEAQRVRGGSLGANMLELGLVGERDFGQTLAELLNVRYAPPEVLQELDDSVRKMLPRALIEKHRGVPIKLESDTLHLLVTGLEGLPDLSATTGLRVVPWIAPEVRVFQELERHFGIPMGRRYDEILQQLRARGGNPIAGSTRSAKATVSELSAECSSTAMGESFGYGRPWKDIAQEMEGDDPVPAEREPTAVGASGDAVSLVERLLAADQADEAMRIVIDCVAERVETCVLFRVRGGTARISDVRTRSSRQLGCKGMTFSSSGSVLELLSVHPYYVGKVPDHPASRMFFDQLGLPMPGEIMLLPLKIGDRVVGILYGDCGSEGGIRSQIADHLLLTRMLKLTLSLVLLKKKIRKSARQREQDLRPDEVLAQASSEQTPA
jgi:hypothetical protein